MKINGMNTVCGVLRVHTLLLAGVFWIAEPLNTIPASAADEPSPQIADWVEELRSDKFGNRETATRALVAAGPAAVDPLTHAAEGANLELALRSIQVLHQMCLSNDDATWKAAENALTKAASGSAEVASRCASDILSTMPSSAIARLRSQGAQVTDESTVKLIGNWRGKDDGLVNLRWMPRLTTLWIDAAPITDAGLQHLRWVPWLRDLAINKVPITDAGLLELKWVTKLQNLYLNETQITDEGIRQLAERTGLRALEIESAGVSDASVGVLSQILSLKILSVKGTKISPAGIAQLRQALPDALVQTNDDAE